MNRRLLLSSVSVALLGLPFKRSRAEAFTVTHSDEEWRRLLTPQTYAVLREEETEPAGTSLLLNENRKGVFACAGCGQGLFTSETKFDSGTGWPSFYDHLPSSLGRRDDSRFFMQRIEVHCSRCGGHLGHVFDDGPEPTGLRYCINGAALVFQPTPSES